jgi:dipeptidyl aminopeptidase/acylaminoacyl peptidase
MEPVPATEPIPIIDFFRPALFQDVQLNHTGTQIGAIVPGDDDHTNLITYNLQNQKIDGISAPSGDKDISFFTWLDGDRLTYIVTQHKSAGGVLFKGEAGRLTTGEPVFPNAPAAYMRILDNPPDDRNQLLVDLNGYEFRYDHPEMINVANGGSLLIRYPELKTDHGFNTGFWSNKTGYLAFGVTQEDGVLALNKLNGEVWQKCPEDLDQINPIASGDNDGEVLVLGPRDGTGPRPLETMDALTGKVSEVILQDKGYDFDGWVFRDPGSHNIVGAIYDRAAPHVVWFTESYRNLQKLVDGLFPGQVVRIQGMDDTGKMLLITNGSDRQPVVYSWVDLEHHKSGLIKNSAPWIDPKRMRPMGIIKYQTAEGRQMDAYVTLPAGASKKNPPPMIVIPHSASGNRWVWGFDSEVQFFASRGYAVLQPNFRGSAGYTWMYPEEEDWDFRKMTDDVAAATRKAIELGLGDPKRVAILGSEFGGYLAVSGAAFEPGLYKCAVSISGNADWGQYIKEDKYEQFTDATYSRYLRKLGDPSREPEKFKAMSPLYHAADVHSALFVAWGEFDDPELISETKAMASAVERNGRPVERISFLDESNGARHLAHRIELYQHIEDFLGKNL